MMGRMAHDFVSRIVQGLDGLRVFFHPVAYYKEGGLHIICTQNVNERLRVLVPPR